MPKHVKTTMDMIRDHLDHKPVRLGGRHKRVVLDKPVNIVKRTTMRPDEAIRSGR